MQLYIPVHVIGCRAVKLDSCNNFLSSVHTILVIILLYDRLNMKT